MLSAAPAITISDSPVMPDRHIAARQLNRTGLAAARYPGRESEQRKEKPVRQTIILVPGLLCDAAVWEHQVRGLEPDHAVLVADLRAFDSITAMARHVLDIAPARFSLAGHSMGARVALEVVRAAPERVDRLALFDTGIHGLRDGEAERRQALIRLGEEEGMGALAEAWLPPMVKEGRLTQDAALDRALRAMVERMNPAIHRNHIAALLGRPDARAALSAVRCPLLVGVGEEDRWSPPSQHEEIAAAVPGSRYVVFADSGHMAPMESPEAVTAALRDWMQMPSAREPGNTPGDVLARAMAEQAIAAQIYRFAQANDAHDHDALAEMFTQDGTFARPTEPDRPVEGREAIRAFFRDRPARRTRHVMANVVVDFLSETEARARSYVVLYSGERGETVLIGDFDDRLVLESDRVWRFASRRGSLAFT